MAGMKTLFSRILFAQVVAVVLALLVVSGITRASLTRGFKDFLERQEATVLENVAPTLTGLYERRGDWDFLRDNPAAWPRIWRSSVSPGGGPPETAGPRSGRGRMRDEEAAGPGADAESQLRWLRAPDRRLLRERLFLVDARRIAIMDGTGTGGVISPQAVVELGLGNKPLKRVRLDEKAAAGLKAHAFTLGP